MHEIKNIESYNQNMRTTVNDKLFFMPMVDFDILVDFGCADGACIEEMMKMKPDAIYIGYDLSDKMIRMAKINCQNAFFFSNWIEVLNKINSVKKPGDVVVVNCSSIIHEVYHYGSIRSINWFWKQIFSGDFDYFVIRDMAISNQTEVASPMEWVNAVNRVAASNVQLGKMLVDFISTYGHITNTENLIHFLLKYRYVANWDRECYENYLPDFVEVFFDTISRHSEIQYFETFALPYTVNQIKNDFGIDVSSVKTHYKLIAKINS